MVWYLAVHVVHVLMCVHPSISLCAGCIFRERKGVSTGEVSEELMEEETQDQKTSEKDDAISELGKLALSTEVNLSL